MKGAVIVGVLLILGFYSFAQDEIGDKGRLISQGEYSGRGQRGEKANAKPAMLDRWSIYQSPDGEYSADIKTPGRPDFEENYTYSGNLQPKSFTMTETRHSGSETTRRRIHCDYQLTHLDCTVIDNDGSPRTSATISLRLPYVFVPTDEIFPLDIAWFSQMVVSQAERTVGYTAKVPIVAMDDGGTENGIKLVVVETELVRYVGRENIAVLGRQVSAHKFRLQDATDPEDSEYIWTSDSGLILEIAADEGPQPVLTEYQGPPLGG